MNPFLQSILLALVRAGLLWLSGHLGVASTEAEVLSAAAAIVGVLWAVWSQFKAHQKLLTAQAIGTVTAQEVAAGVKLGQAPSVLTPKDAIPVLTT